MENLVTPAKPGTELFGPDGGYVGDVLAFVLKVTHSRTYTAAVLLDDGQVVMMNGQHAVIASRRAEVAR